LLHTLQVDLVSHVGHFVLTNALLPLLERTASEPGSDVRIVNVRALAPIPLAGL
jgi:hypothetical protein